MTLLRSADIQSPYLTDKHRWWWYIFAKECVSPVGLCIQCVIVCPSIEHEQNVSTPTCTFASKPVYTYMLSKKKLVKNISSYVFLYQDLRDPSSALHPCTKVLKPISNIVNVSFMGRYFFSLHHKINVILWKFWNWFIGLSLQVYKSLKTTVRGVFLCTCSCIHIGVPRIRISNVKIV